MEPIIDKKNKNGHSATLGDLYECGEMPSEPEFSDDKL